MPDVRYTQLDLNLLPLLNLIAEPIAGDIAPNASNVGRLYHNTSNGHLRYVRDAATVVTLDLQGLIANSDIAPGAAIDLAKLAINPLARANHTGTQVAATISDLDAVIRAYRLDQFTAPTNPVSLGGQRIANLADPTQPTDATTQQWVSNLVSTQISGQDWKASARVASDTNINLASPGSTIDSLAFSVGDRFLAVGQTTPSQNGLYVFQGPTAAATRAPDAASSAQVTSGMTVPITEGTHDNTLAILTTNDPITLGTTALSFTFITTATAYQAGTGIVITGAVISLASPVVVGNGGTGSTTAAGARTNLATPRTGAAANVPALSAGIGYAFVHNLGTTDVIAQARRITDGVVIPGISLAVTDANTLTVTADIAVPTNTLRVSVAPFVS